MAAQIDSRELGVGDFDALGVFVFIQFSADFETGIGCRRCDEWDNSPKAAQRLAAPVDGDERKSAMLDLVPFVGTRWQMADRDGQLELISEFLKFDLP
jgi:hypothetical protein